MKKISLIISVALIAVFVLVLTSCGSTKVSLDKFIDVEFTGYDGYGEANVSFDTKAFYAEYGDDIDFKGSNKLAALLEEDEDEINGAELFYEAVVNYDVKADDKLSNGDEIKVKWKIDEENADEYFDVDIECSDLTFTVEGLDEIKEIDPFEHVTATFEGNDGKGSFSYNTDNVDEVYDYIYYEYDYDSAYNLSNGDTVVLKATVYDENYLASNFGCRLSETEKEFTCEGLAEYVKSIDDIPDDVYEKMDKQLRDTFKADITSWSDRSKLNSFDFDSNYVLNLKPKADSYYDDGNYIYFVYKVSATIEKDEKNPAVDVDYYWYGYYSEVLKDSEGNIDFDSLRYTACGDSWSFDDDFIVKSGYSSFYFDGYQTLDEFETDHLTKRAEKYTYVTAAEEE